MVARRHHATHYAPEHWRYSSAHEWLPASKPLRQVDPAADPARRATLLPLRATEAQLRPLWHDQAQLDHERKEVVTHFTGNSPNLATERHASGSLHLSCERARIKQA